MVGIGIGFYGPIATAWHAECSAFKDSLKNKEFISTGYPCDQYHFNLESRPFINIFNVCACKKKSFLLTKWMCKILKLF